MSYHVLFLSGPDTGWIDRVKACVDSTCESTHVSQIDAALELIASLTFDAIVICEGREIPNAITTCLILRAHTTIPIMVQCEHDCDERAVQAFEAGAQEFVTADLSPRIFAARLLNVLSRSESRASEGMRDGLLVIDGLVLDLESRTAWVGETELPLTRIEFDILSLLMSKPNRVYSRTEIINDVWRDEWYGDDHVLETHVSRLRKKILNYGGPKLITSLRGVGYRLQCAVPPAIVDATGSPSVAKG